MIFRSLLSTVPFVLLNLRATDPGAPAGGGADPDALPETVPSPEGDSLENKLTSATGLIGKFFALAKDFKSRLSTANNERTKLEGQFNAAAKDIETEKTEHTKTRSQLSTINYQLLGVTSERDNANKNVERLEKLCNLRGIDPATIVPASTKPEGSAGNVWEQYQNIRTQEREGKVAPGSAHKFYQKNSKALHEYQSQHRSDE